MKSLKITLSSVSLLLCAILFTTSCEEQEIITSKATSIVSPDSWTINSTAPGSGSKFGTAISNCKWQSSVGDLAGSGGDTDHEDYPVTQKDDNAFYETSNGYLVFITEEGDSERTELRDLSNRSLYENHRVTWTGLAENIDGNNEVTIAQIHNDGGVSRPLMRIYIKNQSIYAKVSENPTGTSTYMTSNVSHSRVWNKVGDGAVAWSNGDALLVIAVIRGDGRIVAYVKNKSTGEIMDCFFTPNYSNWNSYDGNYYFKTGVYNNDDNTDARLSIDYINFRPRVSN